MPLYRPSAKLKHFTLGESEKPSPLLECRQTSRPGCLAARQPRFAGGRWAGDQPNIPSSCSGLVIWGVSLTVQAVWFHSSAREKDRSAGGSCVELIA